VAAQPQARNCVAPIKTPNYKGIPDKSMSISHIVETFFVQNVISYKCIEKEGN
jgi:hypothetical protein